MAQFLGKCTLNFESPLVHLYLCFLVAVAVFSGFRFRSLIYLEFLYKVIDTGIIWFFCMWTFFWRCCLFSNLCFWHFCQILDDCSLAYRFSVFTFGHWPTWLFIYLYHSVFIIMALWYILRSEFFWLSMLFNVSIWVFR